MPSGAEPAPAKAGVTVPRLVAQLRDFGLAVSKRQVVRMLTARQEPFLEEARDVLRAVACGRRHRGTPSGAERLLYPDRQ